MTKTPQQEPWHALPAALADAIEPELPEATEEILTTIAREVPEYARPFCTMWMNSLSHWLKIFVQTQAHMTMLLASPRTRQWTAMSPARARRLAGREQAGQEPT